MKYLHIRIMELLQENKQDKNLQRFRPSEREF